MPYSEFSNINIVALSAAVPDYVQKLDFEKGGRQVRMYSKLTGVKQRHVTITKQTACDLGYVAVKKALEHASWDAKSLDGIIFLTQSPDYYCPGNAHILHHRLHLEENCMALDCELGCSAFPYGLTTACALMQSPTYNRVAVICADVFAHGYPSTEALLADNYFMSGDASSCILLERKEDSSPIRIELFSRGSGYTALVSPYGAARNPYAPQGAIDALGGRLAQNIGTMDGLEVTSFATTAVPESISAFLEKTNAKNEDYNALILHQANLQIVSTIAKALDFSMEQVPLTMDRYANTNGASVPLTIVDAYQNTTQNLRLLTSAFGIGLSWGVADISLDPKVIVPTIFVEGNTFDEGLWR